MLDTTLTTDFVPGTNLKDAVAGANWVFLLPSLEIARVAIVGAPTLAALNTLSKLAQSVTVLCSSACEVVKLTEVLKESSLSRFKAFNITDGKTPMIEDQSIDVLLIMPGDAAKSVLASSLHRTQLRKLLNPQSATIVDIGGPLSTARLRSKVLDRFEKFGNPSLFWMTPGAGREMQGAVPIKSSKVIDYFCDNQLIGRLFKSRPLRTIEGFLTKVPAFKRLFRRYGAIIGLSNAQDNAQPPRYLRSIANRCGANIDDLEWGLSAMGNYNSRKVLFLLFGRSTQKLHIVAKMTRNSELNYRLENEYKALELLRDTHFNCGSIPRPVFFGHHAGLAILGLSAVDGMPFRNATMKSPGCPLIRAAVEWLISLSYVTQLHDVSTPQECASALRALFHKFDAIYRLTSEQQKYLGDQISLFEEFSNRIPCVFQHGDPGTWNVLVSGSNRVAFLDWEAAEPRGIPLWDLFYFLRSSIATSIRKSRTTSFLTHLLRNMHHESPFGALLVESTRRYCETMGIPRDIVRPLFLTCWMHRALKESTRLIPARLEDGHYVNLVRHYIKHPDYTIPDSRSPAAVMPCQVSARVG